MKTLLLHPIVSLYLGLSGLIALSHSFFFATYVPFLAEKGMNLWQINVINACFMVVIIVMEIPTGSFADSFGRHRSLTLSCLLFTLSTLVYFFANSFLIFVVAEIFAGLGHTFYSGAAEAWLVDSLKARDEDNLKLQVFRFEPSFRSGGVIIGAISGAYLGEYNLSWPWLASSILMTGAILLSFKIKENYHNKESSAIRSTLKEQLHSAWHDGLRNKELIVMIIFGACLTCGIQSVNMQWSLLFKQEYTFNSSALGWLFGAISLSMALGSSLAKKVSLYFSEKESIIIPQLFTAAAIIVTALSFKLNFILLFFLLHEFGRGLARPLQQNFINDRLPSKTRATLLSLDSMLVKLGALVGLVASGFIAEVFSIRSAWIVSGSFLVGCVFLFIVLIKPKKVINFT